MFHFRGLPNRFDLTCRLVATLGDGFDFVFYHAQFQSDQQEAGSPMNPVGRALGAGEVYSGEQEVVSIEQVVAASGSRVPVASSAQNTFNVGFIYLVEPGRTANGLLLGRHAAMRDRFVAWWSHVTGNRSGIITNVSLGSDVGFGRPRDRIETGEPILLPDLPPPGVDTGICDHPASANLVPNPGQQGTVASP